MDTLSPNQFGIAGAENFDTAPENLSCADKVAQYCAGNPERCTQGALGLRVNGQDAEHFAKSFPECASEQSTSQNILETNANTIAMNNKDLFNIKSPNFLGGQNVHNVIIIVLALLILVNTGGGNILTAPLKAAKKAV